MTDGKCSVPYLTKEHADPFEQNSSSKKGLFCITKMNPCSIGIHAFNMQSAAQANWVDFCHVKSTAELCSNRVRLKHQFKYQFQKRTHVQGREHPGTPEFHLLFSQSYKNEN